MILTPIPPGALPDVLDAFAASLDPQSRRIFARFGVPEQADRADGATAARHRRHAIALARRVGMATTAVAPIQYFSWDGRRVSTRTDAYVLLHEVAHYQLAAPERRSVVDFGLGAGPETGRHAHADRAQRLFGLAREEEEAMASLLGILWEVELGHPALASFLEQNWLEGAGNARAAGHFRRVLERLAVDGFLDYEGRPTTRLRIAPDRAAAA
jgi:hypothetical protein